MKKSFLWLAALAAMLSFTSCDPKQPVEEEVKKATVSVKIAAKWGNDNFILQNVYYDNYGNRVRVDNFQSYFSMVKLIKSDGTEVLVKDFYLHNFTKVAEMVAEVEPGTYVGLKIGLGVPAEYNVGVDPAQYPSSNPLSVAGSQGMHWTWNSGYVFTKFEGKIDPTATEGAALLNNYSLHSGDDPSYRTYTWSGQNLQFESDGDYTINTTIQVDEILGSGPEGIDLEVESNASGASVLGLKFADRYVNSIHNN